MESPAHSKALAIAPKFTAILSICGSLGIVIKVLSNESRRKKTMHRIVLGMSICDILASIWYFTGTWAIPAGTLSWFGDGETEEIYWAAGDSEGVSCSFAGFFNQFAVATPLYNSTLAVYYLLVVNYGWRDSRIAKIESVFHIIPVGYAVITSVFAVAADLYGHVEWTCWILPGALFDETQELTPMQSKFQWIQWIFLFGAVWSCIIVVTVIFVVLYRKMKSLEIVMTRYSYSSTTVTRSGASTTTFKPQNGSNKGDVRSSDFSATKKTIPESSPHNSDIETGSTDPSGNEEHSQDTDSRDSDETGQNSCSASEDTEEVVVTVELKGSEAFSNREKSIKIPACESSEAFSNRESSVKSPSASFIATSPQNSSSGRSLISWLPSKRGFTNSSKIINGQGRSRRAREVAKSKKIAVQGLLYVGAFYITWFFPTMSRITELVAKKNYFPIQFLDTFLIPLQGFFNFMIYIRPRYIKLRKENEEDGFWKNFKTAVLEIKIV